MMSTKNYTAEQKTLAFLFFG